MSQFIEMFSSVPKVGIKCWVDTIWRSSPDSKTYNEQMKEFHFIKVKPNLEIFI